MVKDEGMPKLHASTREQYHEVNASMNGKCSWRAHLHSADGHGAPAAADLQHVVTLLDVCCAYQRVQLVQLCLLN